MVANLPYELTEEKVRTCGLEAASWDHMIPALPPLFSPFHIECIMDLAADTDIPLQLKELFAAYQPSSAKIALRPIPRFMIKKLQARGEARKGRGFGFVTLASEELQQQAVNEMNGKEIEGRDIAVKVAIDSPDKTDEEANAPADEAEGAQEVPAAETA